MVIVHKGSLNGLMSLKMTQIKCCCLHSHICTSIRAPPLVRPDRIKEGGKRIDCASLEAIHNASITN